MTKYLIASHGKLAEGLYDTFVMVMGKNENLSFFGAYTKAEEDMEEAVKEYVNGIKEEDELIVLTDVFGGSVNNEFMKYIGRKHFYLVSGVSLPLLIEMVTDREPDTAEKIKGIIGRASQFVCDCNNMKLDNNEVDVF